MKFKILHCNYIWYNTSRYCCSLLLPVSLIHFWILWKRWMAKLNCCFVFPEQNCTLLLLSWTTSLEITWYLQERSDYIPSSLFLYESLFYVQYHLKRVPSIKSKNSIELTFLFSFDNSMKLRICCFYPKATIYQITCLKLLTSISLQAKWVNQICKHLSNSFSNIQMFLTHLIVIIWQYFKAQNLLCICNNDRVPNMCITKALVWFCFKQNESNKNGSNYLNIFQIFK